MNIRLPCCGSVLSNACTLQRRKPPDGSTEALVYLPTSAGGHWSLFPSLISELFGLARFAGTEGRDGTPCSR